MNDLISIIVPVYNVEKYLDRCIKSIVNQTYTNLEIILVDDGSPDNCPAMCDKWAEKDRRIKVIHKKNEGAGEARNVALNIANGEYIAFVDSDDYIEKHMIDHLYSLFVDDVGITECSMICTEDDSADMDNAGHAEVNIYSAEDALRLHIADKFFRQTIWNKLYRRNVISDVRFPVGTHIDDEFWTYKVIANANKLIHSSRIMYAYRQQQNSLMHLSFALPRLQAVDAKKERLLFLQQHYPTLISEAKVNFWQTCLYLGQMSMLHMNNGDRKTAIIKLKTLLKEFPIKKDDFSQLSWKQKLWLRLSSASFKTTCRLRNMLKIGI